jgi:hypothetical protein
MNKPSNLTTIFAGLALVLAFNPTTAEPSVAQSTGTRFFCAVLNGQYTTFVRTTRGNVPLIEWTSGNFDQSGWTNEKRCVAVSNRFQEYNVSGQLKYLRTSTVNQLPVLCVAKTKGGSCQSEDVLFTLKQGMDPQDTLTRMLDIRRGAGTAPIQLSNNQVFSYDEQGELYADMNTLVQSLPVENDTNISEVGTQNAGTTAPEGRALNETNGAANPSTNGGQAPSKPENGTQNPGTTQPLW